LDKVEDKSHETSSSSIGSKKLVAVVPLLLTAERESFLCLSNGFSQMSSISQSVLMALTVTFNKFASSNVNAVHKKEGKRAAAATTAKAASRAADIGRRGVLLSTVVGVYSVNDSRIELLKSTKNTTSCFALPF
jgi:hypothetical protein